MTDLRTRLADIIDNTIGEGRWHPLDVADAVIKELDLAITCTAMGCRVRRISVKGAEKAESWSTETFRPCQCPGCQ